MSEFPAVGDFIALRRSVVMQLVPLSPAQPAYFHPT
jgi:hypothetical protein